MVAGEVQGFVGERLRSAATQVSSAPIPGADLDGRFLLARDRLSTMPFFTAMRRAIRTSAEALRSERASSDSGRSPCASRLSLEVVHL